jgi:hypothetical protein
VVGSVFIQTISSKTKTGIPAEAAGDTRGGVLAIDIQIAK